MGEPWVHFEDEHLLVVVKPAGVNTHRVDPHAQDGMYEWAQRRRPDQSLSILHRLDKATSGLLLFGKTQAANRALSNQFATRSVDKIYDLLVTHDDDRSHPLVCNEPLVGKSPGGSVTRDASTDFETVESGTAFDRLTARPHTGRTHQVRIHSQMMGMPILGDEEHGGATAARLFLQSSGIGFEHPTLGRLDLSIDLPASFEAAMADGDPNGASVAASTAQEQRALLFDPSDTNAFVWMDRHHDGIPDVRIERLGPIAFAVNYRESGGPLPPEWLDALMSTGALEGVYEQRRARGREGGRARAVTGSAPPKFEVGELGCRYLIDLDASSTSSGLFLDQRETRRRLLGSDLAGKAVLNVFAHTGSLSVAAAKAGAATLSLDLSKRYLDWARENMNANGIDLPEHDFLFGDAFDWMQRFAKKKRTFDVVLLDPPSTSTTRRGGANRWLVDRDLNTLVALGARLCAPFATMFVSTNLRRMGWQEFLGHLEKGLSEAGRVGVIETQTVPLDHRCGPGDPPYLKAAWVALDSQEG